jgi:hypothetical protein
MGVWETRKRSSAGVIGQGLREVRLGTLLRPSFAAVSCRRCASNRC